MKKHLFLSFLLLCMSGIVMQATAQNRKDSLRNVIAHAEGQEKLDAYMRLTNIYYAEARDKLKRDTLFALYNEMDAEAERQGNDARRAIIHANRLQALNTASEYDEIIKLSPGYMAFAEKKQFWNVYYNLYNPLIAAYRGLGDNDKAMEIAKEMYEHAKARQNNSGMGLAFNNMAQIYSFQRRFTEQEECLRECIALIKDSTALLNVLSTTYIRLGKCLIAQKRYDEAVRIADEAEETIRRYEEFSRSPQPNAWLNQYMVYLDAYRQSGQVDKAEVYVHKIDSLSNGTIPLFEERAAIFSARKQYDKALEMADKAIEAANKEDKLQHWGMKMMILIARGDVEEAQQLFRDIVAGMDALSNEKMNAQLDEIRTQYEVDKINAEKERIRSYLLFALCGCLLLSLLLGIYIYYNRLIRNKNKGLYRQIKQQDLLAEDLVRERHANRQLRLLLKPEDAKWDDTSGDKYFEKLTELMNEQRLFTNPDIRRQDIAGQIGMSDRNLHDCIKKNTGMNFTEYLNTWRLSYSRELLSEEGQKYTTEAIVRMSGFSSRTTFYRLFREKYGLSPEEFKKLL